MDEATVARDLVAIIPLKSLQRAKERLAGALGSEERQALMVGMFDHVVRACQAADAVAGVVVVAGDEDAAAIARRHGAHVLVDRGTGLNGAIATADEAVRAGAVAGPESDSAVVTGAVVTGAVVTGAVVTGTVVTGTATESGGPGAPLATLVVAADLPSASPADIDLLAGLGTGGPCVLVAPTTDGGTGALLRRPGAVIEPMFGPRSAAAHVAAGARAGVRTGVVHIGGFAHDVDRPADLRRLGAPRGSPRRQHRAWPPAAAPPVDSPSISAEPLDDPVAVTAAPAGGSVRPPRSEASMPQGTVKTFDPESRSGTVVLDDQTELAYDTQTFLASGLEELRLGQRVRFEIAGTGDDRRVQHLNLVSM